VEARLGALAEAVDKGLNFTGSGIGHGVEGMRVAVEGVRNNELVGRVVAPPLALAQVLDRVRLGG